MENTLFMIRLAAILYGIFVLAIGVLAGYIIFLIIKALRKYINSQETREQKQIVKKSLGELLKENRIRCKMNDAGICFRGVGRQPAGCFQMGKRNHRPQYLQSDRHCTFIWHFCGRTAAECQCRSVQYAERTTYRRRE